MVRTSPLYDVHVERGARLVEFGGWEMPVQFDSITKEHASVRESVGIFDVSHMGQIEVSGPDGTELMDQLVTNNVESLAPGRATYAAITDVEGTMLDDTVVYRLPVANANDDTNANSDAETITSNATTGDDSDDDDGPRYLFVPNAGHDAEIEDRWRSYREEWNLDATVRNATEEFAMVAVQGPDAAEELAEAVGALDGDAAVCDLGRFGAVKVTIAGASCLLGRTGYTGEDGFEVIAPRDDAAAIWNAFDCQPCGLGARDTLRIEAGFLLSGQDFDPADDPRDPYEAAIGFAVDLDTEFVGRDALARVREVGPDERFTGFELTERGVPRHGYPILDPDGETIATVTSGTMSPTLGEPIGLGYLPIEYAAEGTEIAVEIRNEAKSARIQTTPFIE